MATNFPASVDSLTNPTAGDGLNSPSHSGQHANANDAIEAIEGYLLTGVGTNQLIKIIPSSATNGTVGASGTVTMGSSASSVTVNGAFTSTYDYYKIILSGVTSGMQEIKMTLGGITTNYYSTGAFYFPNTSSPSGFNVAAGSSWTIGYGGNKLINFEIDLYGVNSSQAKLGRSNHSNWHVNPGEENGQSGTVQMWSSSTATATAFTISVASGNIGSGTTVQVFGLKK